MPFSHNKKLSFKYKSNKSYIAFNKPYGVLSQFTQPDNSGKETLSAFNFPADVYPVGRLDYDSEGMLLLSNDGFLNKSLLDPQNQHERTYLVQVENIPAPDQIEKLCRGVVIQGKKTLPAKAKLLDQDPDLPPRTKPIRERKNIPTAWLQLKLSEGRNRQVRHMTAAVQHPTLRLMRIAIGALDLKQLQLQPGKWKYLSEKEVQKLFQAGD